MDSAEVIVLSDDDEDLSCLIVEEKDEKKPEAVLSTSSLDEDLVVTFCQRAEVLPHARYDCPVHPFTSTECETSAPVDRNKLFCDQCFCYICDKLAASCEKWCHSGMCHCNSHKKSKFWTELRNNALLGRLKSFDLTLLETDSHLRHAETMLRSFTLELSTLFSLFLKGETTWLSNSHQEIVYHDYRPVYEFVTSFLDKADEEESRAAAIMYLGATEDFLSHFYLDRMFFFPTFMANPSEAKVSLLQRVIAKMQRLMVMANFSTVFIDKLQDFYQRLPFQQVNMKNVRNSLCVRPWDDVLLVTVLKGQNVSGVRKDKGKRDVLIEQINVVVLRSEALQRQNRHRDLCRYLRVVKTDDPKHFQQLLGLIPFFMCAAGDFSPAAKSIFSSLNPTVGITTLIFLTYLRIFETATVPKVIVWQLQQLCNPNATWEAVEGATPLKRTELVKFALLAQRNCLSIFVDSQCWTKLLTIVNTPSGSSGPIPPPSPQFLHDAWDVVNSILLGQDGSSIHIPRDFLEVYPDQALLLLVTGALALRISSWLLLPAIPVISTFKENQWASRWLYDNLSSNAEHFNAFIQGLAREMENTAGGPAMDKTDSSQVTSSSQKRLVI
ncbi:uncharacterized protein LOC115390213 [Salarias fasciatus]|uniref:Uncharacterized LOC115390213 n=1 Tax=Salarias fasciatus TaxID=181472 RepID=A0A672IHD1_SALFA|nr:uncharacterized protein LOC115390213 [Salarias fasciatus]